MFGNNAEWNAYQLGRSSGGMTPDGPSRAGWYSPQQVAQIELAYQRDNAGIIAQGKALLAALAEAIPDHPLVKKENRLAVYNDAYDTYVPPKK